MTLTSPQLLQIVSAAFVMGCLYYLRQQAPPASAEPSLLRGGAPSAPLSGLYVSAPAKGAAGGAPRVPLPLFPTSYSCTAEEVALQVGRLVPFESACPGSEWWPRLLAAGMSCRDLVMVDIGANKGYKLATWAGVFRPQMGLFPDTLLQRFSEVYREFEDMWGTCQDSADPRLPLIAGRDCDAGAPVAGGGAAAGPPRAADSYKLEVHAFEPLPGNAGILHKVLEPWFVEKGGGTASLTVHQLAMVGDKSISQVEFGACLAGNERCGVKTDGYDGGEVYSKGNVVSAITVDAWFAENGIQRVDVLAIDAEGHDPEVLKGADDVLRRQGARIVEFEYHMLREWGKTSLESVVDKLDGYGYDCFFLQKHSTVIRITGCWDPRLDFHDWSNVMCVLRSEGAMLGVLNSMTPMVTGQAESPSEEARKGSLLNALARNEANKKGKAEKAAA